ncbi:MAG: ABC transporter ATP-binding protein/permease [Firmicutes bacterium]|nr:ABC transporter ATP-binding protein/permease [Bacillota bacterium]
MLKLTDIKKDYKVANGFVHALKGVSLNFRKAGFVSILGPSGCGKTTLLNLIGGLDHATDGDLLINGTSTKLFKDRDWDVYRNHRIGFVFQSYNLIPHQTVLGNVELALTIAGMSKVERVEKAKSALEKVGLSDQIYKKPNQLSGGQCQRVAIARALVNDPEILLADEPTGALDTVTSKQIMDLVKELSEERLVIMVTHNPELADEYSTRIIKLLDGLLVSDSNPYSDEDEAADTEKELQRKAEEQAELDRVYAEQGKKRKKEKAKMSFFTAFRLSLQNLFSKKRRSIMTGIAGSIGIIGVSLVLSVSFGINGFLGIMQQEMMASSPIEITQQAFNLEAMMGGMGPAERREVRRGDWANVDTTIENILDQFDMVDDIMVSNRIDRNYVRYIQNMPQEYWAALHFDYGLDIGYSIFTEFNERQTSFAGIGAMYSAILSAPQLRDFNEFASIVSVLGNPMNQALDTRNEATEAYLLDQYDIIRGDIAREKHEVMIVLDNDRFITDLVLGQIGFYTQEQFINIAFRALGDDRFDEEIWNAHGGYEIPFDALMGQTFTWHPNNNIFVENDLNSSQPFRYIPYVDQMTGYADGEVDGYIELVIVGILEPSGDTLFGGGSLSPGFYFTTALAEHIIEENWNSYIAQFMRNEGYSSLSGASMIMREGDTMEMPVPGMPGVTIEHTFTEDTPLVVDGRAVFFTVDYFFSSTIDGTPTIIDGRSMSVIGGGGLMAFLMANMAGMFGGGDGAPSGLIMTSLTMQQIGANVYSYYYDGRINVIPETVDAYYNILTVFPLPNRIAIYNDSFTQKDNALAYLQNWNNPYAVIYVDGIRLENRETVTYTDFLSFIMDMLSMMILIITIALVAFTSLALIVSCVMIAIITYVSVVERIKEIGVIRSLGGRKRDVSNLFTAETFILGLFSGLIGIIVTYIMSGFINLLVGLANIPRIATLPWWMAIIMVVISIGLTLISGLSPSKSAAKKDPVVALRSE